MHFLVYLFLKKYKEQIEIKNENLEKNINIDEENAKENYSKNLKAAIFNNINI